MRALSLLPFLFVLAPLGAAQSFHSSLLTPPAGGRPPGARPCVPRAVGTPSFSHALDLWPWWSCGSAAMWPYGAKFAPGGRHLYVPLFGGFIGSGGCQVVVYDRIADQVVSTIPTGEGPQEIAFTELAGGLHRGFVTNSSESTVTVFDRHGQVLATIPIPYEGTSYPTAFPTGLAVSPDQGRVYVGTLEGSGRVHAIDVATLTLDPAHRIDLGAGHGATRMAFAGEDLVLAVTEYLPGYAGSTAKVVFVDPDLPSDRAEVVLGSASDGIHFPSASDLAVHCDERVFVSGFDLGPRVFVLDAGTRSLSHSIPTGTSQADGKLLALALSSRGMLAVGDLWANEIAFLDAWTETPVHLWDAADSGYVLAGIQELEFSPDGTRLYATGQGTDSLGVFDLP